MEKVQLSNLALSHLVSEQQTLVNGFINKLQTLENSWMKIKVHTKQGDKTLVVTPYSFFISNKPLNAKQNPGGFSAFLRKNLFNQRIISLTQHGFDRIVVLEFPEKYLVLELFAKGNIILCDKEMKILRALRKEKWKDRILEKDEIYKFPSSRGQSPTTITEIEFLEKLEINNKTFFGACVELLNVSPAIMEFVFNKLKFDKKVDAKSSLKEGKLILKSISKIYSSKSTGIYLSKGNIYSTKTNEEVEQSFSSLNEALNELLIEEIKPFVLEEDKVKKTKDRSGEYLKQIKENELKEIEFKEVAEKIYLEYNTISNVVEAVKKGKAKGLSAKEITEKINSVNKIIKTIDLEKNELVVEL